MTANAEPVSSSSIVRRPLLEVRVRDLLANVELERARRRQGVVAQDLGIKLLWVSLSFFSPFPVRVRTLQGLGHFADFVRKSSSHPVELS